MARAKTQPSGQWLQLRSGAVYHWSKALAKASGSFVVSPQVAADWFRSIGANNETTRAYPPEKEVLAVADEDVEEDALASVPKARARPRQQPKKAPAGKLRSAAGREPTISVSDKAPTKRELQDMIDGSDSG